MVSLTDIDLALALGGLFAGIMVGLTGMGGAALVTPMLVLLFGVSPAAAVSSDVVAAAFMKPVGAWVHIRNHTVHWGLVAWLSAGSIPGVLLGSWVFSAVLATSGADETIRAWIGGVLVLALIAMLAKGYLLGTAVYSTFAYSDAIIDRFFEDSAPVFRVMADAVRKGNARSLLQGLPIQVGFKRLT